MIVHYTIVSTMQIENQTLPYQMLLDKLDMVKLDPYKFPYLFRTLNEIRGSGTR